MAHYYLATLLILLMFCLNNPSGNGFINPKLDQKKAPNWRTPSFVVDVNQHHQDSEAYLENHGTPDVEKQYIGFEWFNFSGFTIIIMVLIWRLNVSFLAKALIDLWRGNDEQI